jgi:hypothetical protein
MYPIAGSVTASQARPMKSTNPIAAGDTFNTSA